MGAAVRVNRVWIFPLWEKAKESCAPHYWDRALCRSLFYCERLCACHSRSDLNGHPVFCTNMRRKEGAPAKKRRGTGQGSDSDHLSFCVVGTTNQRAGFDVGEAEGEALDSKIGK